MSRLVPPFPEWVNEYLPERGPCGICGGPDARHRIIDAIYGCWKAGDSIEDVARNYELPADFVRRLLAAGGKAWASSPRHDPKPATPIGRHDHRRSLWIVCGGLVLWCYRCGAWRMNSKEAKWHRPTGPSGDNPATREGWKP